jgi:hypothetical protein
VAAHIPKQRCARLAYSLAALNICPSRNWLLLRLTLEASRWTLATSVYWPRARLLFGCFVVPSTSMYTCALERTAM